MGDCRKGRKAKKSIMDELSVDLVMKIFTRIPIKSLLRMRCVSKSWCKIIDDPFFAHMQYDCSEVDQNILLYFRKSDVSHPVMTTSLYAAEACDDEESRLVRAATTVPTVNFELSHIDFDGYCKGLMYFIDDRKERIVVANPLRSQFTILPPMPIRIFGGWYSIWIGIGLGFDSSTKTFKMVCTNSKPETAHFTLIHTLGTTSWRVLPTVDAYFSCFPHNDKPVFLHGFLHWMTIPSMRKDGRNQILTFDLSKETFEVIPHPEISFEEHVSRYSTILEIKGNLGVLDISCGMKIDIWVIDYNDKSWSKKYTIDITIVGEIRVTRVIGLWKRDEILSHFLRRKNVVSYWSYSMNTGNLKECEDQSCNAHVYSLKGSLITVPGALKVSRSEC